MEAKFYAKMFGSYLPNKLDYEKIFDSLPEELRTIYRLEEKDDLISLDGFKGVLESSPINLPMKAGEQAIMLDIKNLKKGKMLLSSKDFSKDFGKGYHVQEVEYDISFSGKERFGTATFQIVGTGSYVSSYYWIPVDFLDKWAEKQGTEKFLNS